MITKADFHQNFRFISLAGKLGIIPLTVDLQNGEIGLLLNAWRNAFCMARYILFTLHMLFIVLCSGCHICWLWGQCAITFAPLACHVFLVDAGRSLLALHSLLSVARHHRGMFQKGA